MASFDSQLLMVFFGDAVLLGELRHRLSLADALDDLLLYVRMDAMSGFGHGAAVRLVNFTLTAFGQGVQDSGYPSMFPGACFTLSDRMHPLRTRFGGQVDRALGFDISRKVEPDSQSPVVVHELGLLSRGSPSSLDLAAYNPACSLIASTDHGVWWISSLFIALPFPCRPSVANSNWRRIAGSQPFCAPQRST